MCFFVYNTKVFKCFMENYKKHSLTPPVVKCAVAFGTGLAFVPSSEAIFTINTTVTTAPLGVVM